MKTVGILPVKLFARAKQRLAPELGTEARAALAEAMVRDVLRAAGASIVGGPTSANAYLLHVAPGQRRIALAKLQSDDNVQMAEPIDGTP